jgi:putative flippase GtrA
VKRFRQLLRYSAVSAIATTTSLTVLGVLVGTRAVSPGWANVVATAVGTVPSFELNRRWVWGKRGQRSAPAEIVPFCIMSFAGLALSTLAVHRAAIWAEHAGLSGTARTVAIEAANIGAFGSLWIAQFLILDRVLFRQPSPRALLNGREDDLRSQDQQAVDTAA